MDLNINTIVITSTNFTFHPMKPFHEHGSSNDPSTTPEDASNPLSSIDVHREPGRGINPSRKWAKIGRRKRGEEKRERKREREKKSK